jgi:hypothetical protein
MKKNYTISINSAFTILSCNAYSQFSLGKMISKVESGTPVGQDEEEKTLDLRGPEAPVDKQYGNYKTYEIKLDLSTGIEDSLHLENSIFK